MFFQWMCNFLSVCPHYTCMHNLRCHIRLGLRAAGCWLTLLQWRDGSFTTLFIKWILNKCEHLHLAYSSTESSSSRLPSTHITLRFYKALCHLMHYSTDLCPLWLAMCRLLYRRPANAMQVNVLIEASEWLSLVSMYMVVLLCHKI